MPVTESQNPNEPLKPRLQGLYFFLGSEARVLAILKDLYRRLSADTMVGFFFDGKNLDAIAEKQAEFLLRAMGARSSYSGKAPASAHLGLAPILPGHFDRRLQILRQTLLDHGLPNEHIETWIDFENAFRATIVR